MWQRYAIILTRKDPPADLDHLLELIPDIHVLLDSDCCLVITGIFCEESRAAFRRLLHGLDITILSFEPLRRC